MPFCDSEYDAIRNSKRACSCQTTRLAAIQADKQEMLQSRCTQQWLALFRGKALAPICRFGRPFLLETRRLGKDQDLPAGTIPKSVAEPDPRKQRQIVILLFLTRLQEVKSLYFWSRQLSPEPRHGLCFLSECCGELKTDLKRPASIQKEWT